MSPKICSRLIVLFLLPFASMTSIAQENDLSERIEEIDSVVSSRYHRIRYDTAYIMRPEGKLTLKLRTNLSGSSIRAKRDFSYDIDGHSHLTTNPKATISIAGIYQGIGLGFAFNPAKFKGKNKDFSLNMNIYKNRFGVELAYQSSKTLSGDSYYGDQMIHLDKGAVDLNTLNINAYYAFSGSRFSYPAAFTQSYIQKRSAGSWLLGFSFVGGTIKSTEQSRDLIGRLKMRQLQFALGGGYGYNFVVKKRTLFHISAVPTLVVASWNRIELNGSKIRLNTHFPHFILTERAAVIHNINKKFFTGFTFVMSNSVYFNNKGYLGYNKWYGRLLFGMRI